MSAEESVIDALMQTLPRSTAEFLIGCLKEEWLTEKAEKDECNHELYRNVYGETGVWNRCDVCGSVNV